MNEQLVQLAKKAGLDFDEDVWLAMPDELEKFAKLVANECIEMVQWCPEVHSQREQDVLNQAVSRIQEVFGSTE